MFYHLTHWESGPRGNHGAADPEQTFLSGSQNYVATEALHERIPLEAEQVEWVRTASPRVPRATDECNPDRYSRKRLIQEDDPEQLDVGCVNGAPDWFAAHQGHEFGYERDVVGDAAGFTVLDDSPNQKVPAWSPDAYTPEGVSVDAPEGCGSQEMLNQYEIAARAHCRPSEFGIRQMDTKADCIEVEDGSFGYNTAMAEASLYNISKDSSYDGRLSPTETALEMCSYDPRIAPVIASKPVVLQSPLEFIVGHAGRRSPMPCTDEQETTMVTGINKNREQGVEYYPEQQYMKAMDQTEHLPARIIGHKLAYNGIADRQSYRSVQDDPFQCERDIEGGKLVFGSDVAARNEQSVFGRDVAARNEHSVFGSRAMTARNEQSVFPISIAKTGFPSETSTKSEATGGERFARVVRGEPTEVPVCGEYRNYDDVHRVKLWTEFGDVCRSADGSTGRRVATAERHSASLVQPVRWNDQPTDRGKTHNETASGFGEQQPRMRHPSPVAVVVGRSSPWYAAGTPNGASAATTPSNTGYPPHGSGEVSKTPARRSSTPNRTPNIAPVTPCVRRPVHALELGATGGGTERTRQTTKSRGEKMGQIWPLIIWFSSSCM